MTLPLGRETLPASKLRAGRFHVLPADRCRPPWCPYGEASPANLIKHCTAVALVCQGC